MALIIKLYTCIPMAMHLHEWINFTSFVLQLSLESGADAIFVEINFTNNKGVIIKNESVFNWIKLAVRLIFNGSENYIVLPPWTFESFSFILYIYLFLEM